MYACMYVQPSEYGTHLDAKAAFHWIYDRIAGHNQSSPADLTEGDTTLPPHTYTRSQLPYVYVYGHSLGSGVGSGLVAEINRLRIHVVYVCM